MRTASPKVLAVARRLLETQATGEDGASEIPADAWRRSCEALRPRLTQLVGREGFHALLSRALALTKAELPWWSGVQVDEAGSLTAVDAVLAGREPAETEAGAITMLAHLLGLLATFIGVGLTRQLVSSAWPDVPLDDTDFSTEVGEV